MACWLLKTEPTVYSYDDLERDQKSVWDGVTNNLALKYIRQVQRGDLALIYHTGEEKAIVGIAEVASAAYADPKQKDPKLAVFDLQPLRRLPRAVGLAEVKANEKLKDFELVRMARLSVMPVSEPVRKILLKMAGEK
ncbi:MAG: EVE domain-containing protein [Acidobacteria bacterium]|nr:EVE domain-containing protein [Acidobacteriota bacterium]MCI0620694.1 EVE domain-containing protein [Acidobacteriota bacterium]MCI0719262.1 EVE domain-containing protein [Acidobacteriota bacterium]